MCEINPGQLILCYSRHDPAARNLMSSIREGGIEHVSYGESMMSKLERARMTMRDDLELECHLLHVPEGQENWKSHYLQFYYKHEILRSWPDLWDNERAMNALNQSTHQFTAAPNHVLSLSQPSHATPPISSKMFAFGPQYGQYKQLVGLPASSPGAAERVRIAVVDSGIARDAAQRMRFPIVSEHNLLDATTPNQGTDENGHGTAVTLLIDDLAVNAEFVVIKVADKDGSISEWDALAALVAQTRAHVVNLSLQFGLKPRAACAKCGRRADTMVSRSAVFENIVQQVWDRPEQPVLVAAAGNSALPELAYPSRFGNVLAIGAVTSTGRLATDSNYGDLDAAGSAHAHHYVMPGGEANLEDVLLSSNGARWSGTSFAAAFATAVVSAKMSQRGFQQYQRDLLLQDLIGAADKSMPNFTTVQFGNGIMRA